LGNHWARGFCREVPSSSGVFQDEDAATLPGLRGSLEDWFDRYNNWRPHERLGNPTPAVVYQTPSATPKAA
jgi:transposase InsO family protein